MNVFLFETSGIFLVEFATRSPKHNFCYRRSTNYENGLNNQCSAFSQKLDRFPGGLWISVSEALKNYGRMAHLRKRLGQDDVRRILWRENFTDFQNGCI